VNGRQRFIEFTELGTLVPFKYPITAGRDSMNLELVAQGPTIVLYLKPFNEVDSVYTYDNAQSTMASQDFKIVSFFMINEHCDTEKRRE
jgi:hypothetical protein